jgi:hypothetical protein
MLLLYYNFATCCGPVCTRIFNLCLTRWQFYSLCLPRVVLQFVTCHTTRNRELKIEWPLLTACVCKCGVVPYIRNTQVELWTPGGIRLKWDFPLHQCVSGTVVRRKYFSTMRTASFNYFMFIHLRLTYLDHDTCKISLECTAFMQGYCNGAWNPGNMCTLNILMKDLEI